MSVNKTFVIPSVGNEISKLDVKSNQIRITVDFKPYFPEKSKVKIVIDNEYSCTFTHRVDRSHILRLGKVAAEELGLKPRWSVRFTKMGDSFFKLGGI